MLFADHFGPAATPRMSKFYDKALTSSDRIVGSAGSGGTLTANDNEQLQFQSPSIL